eukprot:TRINITY_DN1386_c0_g1_i1.p1 TRINITY_DN1386_c0_g1~~TRINITY_DN1386_c0_g1_i1.p1  ORF type:complete len:145 (-),score=24.54 TRINITY_DN1386_c0_g1_i1:110-544(-)
MQDDGLFARFLIKEYQHWKLFLCDDQSFLGRTYLWAKRTDDVDIIEMTDEERNEFFAVGAKLKAAINALYHPARLNYAALSNEAHHLHVHILPRYNEDREIYGILFKDTNKGGPPWPGRKDFVVSEETLQKIRADILTKLESLN